MINYVCCILIISFTLFNSSCEDRIKLKRAKTNKSQLSSATSCRAAMINASHVTHPSRQLQDTLKFTNGIRLIHQDKNGHYWFGSHAEGVCRFDGRTFEYFTMEDGLADNQVRAIKEDASGTIYFATARGVNSYDGERIKLNSTSTNNFVPAAWKKTADDLWFHAGNNPGVNRYDGQELIYLAFPAPKVDQSFESHYVTAIAEGHDDMVWIATYPAVYGYNGRQLNVINSESLGLNDMTGSLHVRSIFEDSNSRLWIGNNGIGVLLKEDDKTINFSEKQGLIHVLSQRGGAQSPPGTLEHVFAIAEDHLGNIWFGDRDTGAWKYDGKTMTNYMIHAEGKSQMIWDIYEDQDKNLLFAMLEGGIYQFNGTSFDRRF